MLHRRGKLGEGAYGVIYEATLPQTNFKLAVKRNLVDSRTDFSMCLKEADLLLKLKGHPHIVELIKIDKQPFPEPFSPREQTRDDPLNFIFKKATIDGRLLSLRQPTVALVKKLMTHLLLGVEYLHFRRVIHRDLKPENTLWFEDSQTLKICDFGLSEIYYPHQTQPKGLMTSWYRAPEVCQGLEYDYKADMWSVGCCFYEFLTGRALLAGVEQDDNRQLLNFIFRKLPAGSRAVTGWAGVLNRWPIPQKLGVPLLADLLAKILVVNPADRYSASQALNHPFFHDQASYIKRVRQYLVAPNRELCCLNLCPERVWTYNLARKVFATRLVYPWYQHRALFLALSLMDRHLIYKGSQPVTTNQGEEMGRYYSKFGTELRFTICLYIAVKYLTVFRTELHYSQLLTSLFPDKYGQEELAQFEDFAQDFEAHLTERVLDFQIYRDNSYELSPWPLTDHQISELLRRQANLTQATTLEALLANL